MKVVIYSGGADSYTLLHWVISEYGGKEDLVALSFNYGQRHKKELGFAREECARLGIRHHVVDLRSAGELLTGSALTLGSIPVPHGHYQEDSMRATVVPGRNTIMLAIAIGVAEAEHKRLHSSDPHALSRVFYGAHAGDHYIYPDCRDGYVRDMNKVAQSATLGNVVVEAPFINNSKGEIIRIGDRLGLDYSRAWTCYEGGDEPCGKCGACVERAEAFAFADIDDPLLGN